MVLWNLPSRPGLYALLEMRYIIAENGCGHILMGGTFGGKNVRESGNEEKGEKGEKGNTNNNNIQSIGMHVCDEFFISKSYATFALCAGTIVTNKLSASIFPRFLKRNKTYFHNYNPCIL